ncbi:MAG: hypothetical protein OEY64_03845 [Nitrospinota bacterium]|nr:hypothetical protein [Nitrospinota bacterium]
MKKMLGISYGAISAKRCIHITVKGRYVEMAVLPGKRAETKLITKDICLEDA